MKLTLKDKLEIIKMYETSYSIAVISKKFKVNKSVIKQIERQYLEHGIKLVKPKGKNENIHLNLKWK